MTGAPINPGPVLSANTRLIGEASFPVPSMRSTILGWFRPMTIILITTTITSGEAKETQKEIQTSGMVQSGPAEKLDIKAEGDRSWEPAVLHSLPNLVLQTNDRIIIAKKPYRVMQRNDWTAYGYMRYDLIQDFTRGN